GREDGDMTFHQFDPGGAQEGPDGRRGVIRASSPEGGDTPFETTTEIPRHDRKVAAREKSSEPSANGEPRAVEQDAGGPVGVVGGEPEMVRLDGHCRDPVLFQPGNEPMDRETFALAQDPVRERRLDVRGRLHQGEETAQPVELPDTGDREPGVSAPDLLENLAVPLLRPRMSDTFGEEVRNAFARRGDENERRAGLPKDPDVVKDPVQIGERCSSELEDDRPDLSGQRVTLPFARAGPSRARAPR